MVATDYSCYFTRFWMFLVICKSITLGQIHPKESNRTWEWAPCGYHICSSKIFRFWQGGSENHNKHGLNMYVLSWHKDIPNLLEFFISIMLIALLSKYWSRVYVIGCFWSFILRATYQKIRKRPYMYCQINVKSQTDWSQLCDVFWGPAKFALPKWCHH